jgi:hypothetical protein
MTNSDFKTSILDNGVVVAHVAQVHIYLPDPFERHHQHARIGDRAKPRLGDFSPTPFLGSLRLCAGRADARQVADSQFRSRFLNKRHAQTPVRVEQGVAVATHEKAAAGVEISDGSHSRGPAKSAIIKTLIRPG